MKKVLFTVALALVAVVASAQEPNFPMMGGGFGGFGGFGGLVAASRPMLSLTSMLLPPRALTRSVTVSRRVL